MRAAPHFYMLVLSLVVAGCASEPAVAQNGSMQPRMLPQQQQPFNPQAAIDAMARQLIMTGMPVQQALQTATLYVSSELALMRQYPPPQQVYQPPPQQVYQPPPQRVYQPPPQQVYQPPPPDDPLPMLPVYRQSPPQPVVQPPPPAYQPPPPPLTDAMPPLIPSCAEGYRCMGRALQADGVWR
jgi:hypothetical protein